MPTEGRLVRRLDGRLYRDSDGRLMRWPSAYPIDVDIYFGAGGDETLAIDLKSGYYLGNPDYTDAPDYYFRVASGSIMTLRAPFAAWDMGYYLTTATSAYDRTAAEWVEVASGARWEIRWKREVRHYDEVVMAVYWSTIGVWGPYQTDAAFFKTTMNFSEDSGNRTRTGIHVPSSMYLRPSSSV